MPLAFFDLDYTVFDCNLGRRILAEMFATGSISPRWIPRALASVVKARAGWITREVLVARAGMAFRGARAADLADRVARFYHATGRRRVRPAALVAIGRHQRAGDRCVVVTSWPEQLAAPVCADLGFSAFLGNRLEVDAAGSFTGRVREPICFGRGKLARALEYADAEGERLDAATAYGNSWRGDLDLLAAVGRPLVVAPDRRLAAEARCRGWEFAGWDEAT